MAAKRKFRSPTIAWEEMWLAKAILPNIIDELLFSHTMNEPIFTHSLICVSIWIEQI